MRLSNHAKERLIERFEMSPRDIELVGNTFNQKNKYKLIKKTMEREIREITYEGTPIQCVIVEGIIRTCHWDTFVEDDDVSELNLLTEEVFLLRNEISYYKRKLKKKDRIMKKLGTRSVWHVFWYIFNLRKNWEEAK